MFKMESQALSQPRSLSSVSLTFDSLSNQSSVAGHPRQSANQVLLSNSTLAFDYALLAPGPSSKVPSLSTVFFHPPAAPPGNFGLGPGSSSAAASAARSLPPALDLSTGPRVGGECSTPLAHTGFAADPLGDSMSGKLPPDNATTESASATSRGNSYSPWVPLTLAEIGRASC